MSNAKDLRKEWERILREHQRDTGRKVPVKKRQEQPPLRLESDLDYDAAIAYRDRPDSRYSSTYESASDRRHNGIPMIKYNRWR